MPNSSLRTAARLARRIPGYRWVRRRTLPRIRQSTAVRTVVDRVFPSASNGSRPSADVAPGRLLGGLGVEQLPVVLLSLIGLTDEAAEHVVRPARVEAGAPTGSAHISTSHLIDEVTDEVAELQLLGAGFRPVFLLDTPAFSRPRSYGYAVELVMPAAAWSGEPADWAEYVGARIASMARAYGISGVVTVGRHGLDDVGRALLRSYG